ncbi:hypothetical protein FHS18_006110 [Paenibacillus phyllosphaerae]|uniref:Uncharacterized protein n=1 Tax=Paenibacillus phyllosphaerae TaxID=274593 RepID=A0A7W5B4H2_9BACL|nr:hypothetical protein [Paenibacillus phyllosphaerae]MBB3113994.1 hypothetical protein [Paenibacillus phyllosphaerae]
MRTYQERMDRITLHVAEEAWKTPRLASGLWHHNDIRNNFYEAVYLLAASVDYRLAVSFPREEGAALARAILANVLSLQDQEEGSPTIGHWPLHLGDNPARAAKNPLPAELMSCLMAVVCERYASELGTELAASFEQSLAILYRSGFYLQPQRTFSHHETKYTAAKILFGDRYGDEGLLASGRSDLRLTLERLRAEGMAEYGALPWFWHWVQSLTSAYVCISDADIKGELADLLELLWHYRAQHYLKGAWIGGRMRSLPVDLPRDRNVAFDYVQFGDFELPLPLSRVEFAGLLHYEASESTRQYALRTEPEEIRYSIQPATGGQPLHGRIYRTAYAATGGITERASEFDNEQHRWELTLPLTDAEGANRLYLFSPGEGYTEGDPRHESDAGDLLFHGHAVLGLYGPPVSSNRLVGVLPKGEWRFEGGRAYGELRQLYVALFMPGEFATQELSDYIALDSPGQDGMNGFVMEAIAKSDAAERGIHSIADFAAFIDERRPNWTGLHNGTDGLSVSYLTFGGDELKLSVQPDSSVTRTVRSD